MGNHDLLHNSLFVHKGLCLSHRLLQDTYHSPDIFGRLGEHGAEDGICWDETNLLFQLILCFTRFLGGPNHKICIISILCLSHFH